MKKKRVLIPAQVKVFFDSMYMSDAIIHDTCCPKKIMYSNKKLKYSLNTDIITEQKLLKVDNI